MGGLEEWGPDCDWASGNKKGGSKERKLLKRDLKVLFCTGNWPVQVTDRHCQSLQVGIFEKCQFKKLSEAWIQYDVFALWISSSSHMFLWPNEVQVIFSAKSPASYFFLHGNCGFGYLKAVWQQHIKLLLNNFTQRRHFFLTGIFLFLCCICLPHRQWFMITM